MNAGRIDRALRRALWVALSMNAVGCGAMVMPGDGDGGVDGGVTCVDPTTGRRLRPGESNGDRCPCVCTDLGLQCAGCRPPVCRLPDGRTIPVGETFSDGCNACSCDATGNVTCTARECVDAGPPSDSGACTRTVRSPNSCQSEIVFSCGIPGGPLTAGDPRCQTLCAGVGPVAGLCQPGSTPNTVMCISCGVGRFTEGMGLASDGGRPDTFAAWLAEGAAVEAIAAVAFDRLADELSLAGAPDVLVARARGCADEERGHAKVMERLARAEGVEVTPSTVSPHAPRALVDIALENAVEGCVRETLGAVIMGWQARHAQDPAVRDALSAIAREESSHAAWSWELDAWARTALAPQEVAAMDRARDRAIAALSDELGRSDPSVDLSVKGGMPSAAVVRAMISELSHTLWQA
jgi:hypothetical protein